MTIDRSCMKCVQLIVFVLGSKTIVKQPLDVSPSVIVHGVPWVDKQARKHNSRAFHGVQPYRGAVLLFSKSHSAVRCGFCFLRIVYTVRCGAMGCGFSP